MSLSMSWICPFLESQTSYTRHCSRTGTDKWARRDRRLSPLRVATRARPPARAHEGYDTGDTRIRAQHATLQGALAIDDLTGCRTARCCLARLLLRALSTRL